MYIINNPGDIKWQGLGASFQDHYQGFAFLATADGMGITYTPASNPSYWELETAKTGNLALDDAAYTTGEQAGADKAELVYTENAFGVTDIKDFNPTLDPDGMYPAKPNVQPEQAYSLFVLKAFDGPREDLFADFTVLAVKVNNDDQTRPFARLYDLNPKTEGMDWNGENQDRAIAPMGIGANRT